ncbi:MAG: hypothetical protein L3K06_07135, partial [Thermoplasmata archaeon]|nr:hypothetical protein [Thermoplasmata archaeon]
MRGRRAGSAAVIALLVLLLLLPQALPHGPASASVPLGSAGRATGPAAEGALSHPGADTASIAPPAVRTLIAAGTQIAIPAYTWFTYNFTIDQAVTFQGRWDSNSTFDSYVYPTDVGIFFRPLCNSLNLSFNQTLFPNDYTLWILPCDFSQNATVSITNAAELVYGFTTVWLGAAGSIGLGVGEFLVWNFTLPSNVSWMEFGADLVGLPPELGLLDAAELASFLANPGAFNFSTLIDYGPPGPPVAGVVPGAAASPPAGPYAVVAYNSA